MRALWLLLAGCPAPGGDTGPTLDTGWFTEPVDPGCEDVVLATFPRLDQADWYWRSPPIVQVATGAHGAYQAALLDALGAEVPTTPSWTGTQLALGLAAPLTPDAEYLLRVTDCLGRHDAPFRTSPLGAPLEVSPRDLIGRTYSFDIARARWEQPPGLGALLSLYFTDPVLIGVEWSSPEVLDLLGGQGVQLNNGDTQQYMSQPTWDFPVADFTERPYFEAAAPSITIAFDGVELIINDFRISATLSADGESMGGGWVSGLGDTRHLGPVLNQGDRPDAACRITAGFGAECVACPDGQPYCLPMSARDVRGSHIPGLRLLRRD